MIPTDSLSLSNGLSVKSYHLLMRVSTSATNGFVNKEADLSEYCTDSLQNFEIWAKTQFQSRFPLSFRIHVTVPSNLDGPNPKKRKVAAKDDKHFVANLTVYDKRNRCLLPDGEYQLLMHEWTQNSPSKVSHVNTSWETIPDMEVHDCTIWVLRLEVWIPKLICINLQCGICQENETSAAFETYAAGPKLKLRLCWTNNASEDPSAIISAVNETNDEEMSSNLSNSSSNKENNNPGMYHWGTVLFFSRVNYVLVLCRK